MTGALAAAAPGEELPTDTAACEAVLPSLTDYASFEGRDPLRWAPPDPAVVAGSNLDARWLADEWVSVFGTSAVRRIALTSFESGLQSTAEAFRAHLGANTYYGLPTLSPAEDWEWPLRIAIPRHSQYENLRGKLENFILQGTPVARLITVITAEDVNTADFLVLWGPPVQALEEIETMPTTIRAHCLMLLQDGELEFPEAQSRAVARAQQRTLAKAVVAANRSQAESWLISLIFELSHNRDLDDALNSVVKPLPALCLDSSVLKIARLDHFAEKVSQSLETAPKKWITFDDVVDLGVKFSKGTFGVRYVSSLLRAALQSAGAFLHESGGAFTTVNIARSAKNSGVTRAHQRAAAPVRKRQPERITQVTIREGINEPATFEPGRHYQVSAWIGAAQQGAFHGLALRQEMLPGEEEGHLLTVTFFAPLAMNGPVVETIYLPRVGDSTRCAFSFETGTDLTRWEGRLTIAYLNRILQTYLLSGGVDEPIALHPEMATQPDWQGLDGQTAYGASLVLNKMQRTRVGVAQAGYRALAFSLDGLAKEIEQIEMKIDTSTWEAGEFQDAQAAGSLMLLHYLAKHGAQLLNAVKAYAPSDAAGQTWLKTLLASDPIQVVAANLDARLPIEFFYANPYPKDKAVLCPVWTAETARESCDGCPNRDSDHFCPLGFWSLTKTIEWHDFEAAKQKLPQFAPRAFAIEGDAKSRRDRLAKIDRVLIGISEKAGEVEPKRIGELIESIEQAGLKTVVVKSWDQWKTHAKEGFPLLLLVPHSLTNAFEEECIEIGGESLSGGLIAAEYVANGNKPGPVVLLLGCNTDNLGISFRSFSTKFMLGGSAIVVSTVAHILGRHAAPLAAAMVREIVAAQSRPEPVTFGRVMRDVRRNWLRGNLPPVSLGLKCYGDARWRL
ncbi:MAG: hypothetical protein JWN34_3250 [Bryobacterales bacterium]|nr:hypothetical protein [Bryobacterales bacterium]